MMSNVQVLGSEAVLDLTPAAVLAAVRAAFASLGQGRASQPLQTVVPLSNGGDVITYLGLLEDVGVFGVKVSPYLPRAGGPAIVTAWTLLVSTSTGEPVLLCDAGVLTTQRTAAASALAIDLLARPDATRIALIGTGKIGRAHLRYAREVRGFTDIRVYNRSGVDPTGLGEGVRVASTAEDAARGAAVVMLCTSAAEPVVDVAALAPGAVITSISTNAPDAREIDPAVLPALEVYCDHSPSAAAAAGEMRLAARAGTWSAAEIRGDLAGLLGGVAPPPTGERPVFFRSVGLGIEDLAIARLLLPQDALRAGALTAGETR